MEPQLTTSLGLVLQRTLAVLGSPSGYAVIVDRAADRTERLLARSIVGSSGPARPLGSDSAVLPLAAFGRLEVSVVFERGAVPSIQEAKCGLPSAIPNLALAILERYMMTESARSGGHELEFLGTSSEFLRMEHQLKNAARFSDVPVLITGERGAGKEAVAYAIHYFSARQKGPFLVVNSPALNQELYAAELFGYRKGSFTGAIDDRPGKFRAAAGGTIFFDEITELPDNVRPGLLRALDQHEVQSIGYDQPLRVNVRIIAATNKDMEHLVRNGKFPPDLYDRLNVLRIQVPPLRNRREDIPLLVEYFLRRYCCWADSEKLQEACTRCTAGGRPSCVGNNTVSALVQQNWPGNIRELKNAVFRLMANEDGLEPITAPSSVGLQGKGFSTPDVQPGSMDLQQAVRDYIVSALQMTHWNKSAAARALGLPLSTLISRMKRMNIALHASHF